MIVVFGSLNVDLVTRVARLPHAGETVLGGDYEVFAGGKGANQALAARRAGAEVTMAGAVGLDGFAEVATALLTADGVDLGRVARVPGPTGAAFISVDAGGANQIVVAAGANARARAAQLEGLAPPPGSWLLVQRETPEVETAAAIRWAKASGLKAAMNLAPSGPLPAGVLADLDLLVMNEHEAADLAGLHGFAANDPAALCRRMAEAFGLTAAITLGGEGAVAHDGAGAHRAAALPVTPVDTTAAGDASCGALLAALDAGMEFGPALALACAAGSLACLRHGAQPSLPRRAEIETALAEQAGKG